MFKTTTFLVAALVAAPAFAADLPITTAPAKSAPAAPAATSTTIGLEVGPEFFADPANAKYGQVNDGYFKGSLSESLGNGFSVGTSLQLVDKVSNTPATYQYLVDVTAAYKFKLDDNFSITATGGVGYTWGNTGYTGGTASSSGVDPFVYYFATAALDDKIDSNWTWNIVNVRYRNAIGVTWLTPKIQTGITYNIDKQNAVYANIGYAWKDSGSGLKADKFNVAVGYKYSF
jgi:hypothetical protein